MTDTQSNSGAGGITFVGALTLLFIALKLIPLDNGHIIDWSWWWVLSPLWISASLAVLACVAFIVGGLVAVNQKGKR